VFFKILNGFYWACRVSKEAEFCAKMCRTLASRSSQRFFSQKNNLCKIFQVPKILVFCKKCFPFCQTRDFCTFLKSAQNSASFDTLHAQFRRNFLQLFIRIKGQIRLCRLHTAMFHWPLSSTATKEVP